MSEILTVRLALTKGDSHNELQVMHGGMVWVDDHIYGGHGHNGGSPFCLDVKTGKLDWKERGVGFGSAGVVYADGNLYFRYEDNVLALVEATPEGYHLRSKFQIGIQATQESWTRYATAPTFFAGPPEQDRYTIRTKATEAIGYRLH